MAYSVGLSPRDVWESTPAELSAIIEARLDRDSAGREFTAAMVSVLARCQVGSKAPRAHDLLGPGDRARALKREARALEQDKAKKAEG